MEIRKTTSVTLAAVAAAAFSLPTASFAQAQPAPAPAGGSGTVCYGNGRDFEVSSTEYASIADALKVAQDCNPGGDITIRVVANPSTPAVLPATIPAGFSRVVITGQHYRNTVLTQVGNGSTVVKSPTEIRYADIHVNGGDVPALISHSSLVVSDSAITGNGLLVGDNRASRNATTDASVTLAHNDFDRAGAINTGRGYKSVTVVDNAFNTDFGLEHSNDANGTAVVRGISDLLVLAPTTNAKAEARITNNRFVSRGNGAGTFVSVLRPNVSITDNAFKGADDVLGIRFEVPSRAGRNNFAFATNLDVNRNTFELAKPIVQDQALLPRSVKEIEGLNAKKEALHVRVSNNRFVGDTAPALVFTTKVSKEFGVTKDTVELTGDKVVLGDNKHLERLPNPLEEDHEIILEED